jgi:putative lipoic acid-binding regulatory protein
MATTPTLEFPCAYPLKVMGRDSPEFRTAARSIVERHLGPVPETVVTARASSEGNFLALTFTITAESRVQLDGLYRELSSCPEILVAL